MFTKPVAQLIYSDIDDLVNVRKEREGYFIDYKGESSNPDKLKNELAKDISAFANSSGGYLIMGVDKDGIISGISPTIQNRPVDEWLNQVISSNIDPLVFYEDPKVIQMPEKDKVVVVIHVPESARKPHMVTSGNNYYIRINDSCKTANHSQVRDMFESSRNKTEAFHQFLKEKSLMDERSKEFGMNRNSELLYNGFATNVGFLKPVVLLTLVPSNPNDEKVKVTMSELIGWLRKNGNGYQPEPGMRLYDYTSNPEIKYDGVLYRRYRSREDITSYFEVLTNGFVEFGLSATVTHFNKNESPTEPDAMIFLSQILAFEMMLLGFAKRFYEYIRYPDDVMIQLSFINVLNLRPVGLHESHFLGTGIRHTKNKHHNNFNLTHKFNLSILSDNEILAIVKHHAERMCMAFGLERDYCFYNDNLGVGPLNNLEI